MGTNRALLARKVREQAADLAQHRVQEKHKANADQRRYGSTRYAMSFSKGLEHDEATGLVSNSQHFEAFRYAIDSGHVDVFTSTVPVPRDEEDRRQWEAPTAGFVYDLQGPDAQSVSMPPCLTVVV